MTDVLEVFWRDRHVSQFRRAGEFLTVAPTCSGGTLNLANYHYLEEPVLRETLVLRSPA